jgi:hypothetical protein
MIHLHHNMERSVAWRHLGYHESPNLSASYTSLRSDVKTGKIAQS